jgi:hypothetical protein
MQASEVSPTVMMTGYRECQRMLPEHTSAGIMLCNVLSDTGLQCRCHFPRSRLRSMLSGLVDLTIVRLFDGTLVYDEGFSLSNIGRELVEAMASTRVFPVSNRAA